MDELNYLALGLLAVAAGVFLLIRADARSKPWIGAALFAGAAALVAVDVFVVGRPAFSAMHLVPIVYLLIGVQIFVKQRRDAAQQPEK